MWTIIGNGTIEPGDIEGQERETEAAAEPPADRSGGPRHARGSLRRRVSEWCGGRMIDLGDRLLHHSNALALGLGA